VVVSNADGKKGIGTEMFEVTLKAEALPDGTHVLGVDEFGNAVGRATSTATCTSQVLPILWRADGTRVALPLGSFCGGTAEVINRSGVILGEMSGGPTNSHALWTPVGTDYVMQEIAPAPDGYRPITRAMNDNGEIAGWGQRGAEVFYWSAATGWLPMQVPAGATLCQAFDAINNNGVIIAKCVIGGVSRPFVWQSHDAAPQQLPVPAGYGDVIPEDINDAGLIVGYGTSTINHALEWIPSGGAYTVTVLPDAGYGSVAMAIAEDGTVAGEVYRSRSMGSPQAAYWPGGGYRLLAMDKSGTWGQAMDIASGALGLVAGGSRGNTQAVRWRQ
jgi:uncharacterized membrane protein